MDDNATCHRTLAVQDCLDSEGIQRLVWPARSPDLNPIENVWDALGRQVAGRNYPPTNKNTLIRALTEEWDKLPQQLLDSAVQSMKASKRNTKITPNLLLPCSKKEDARILKHKGLETIEKITQENFAVAYTDGSSEISLNKRGAGILFQLPNKERKMHKINTGLIASNFTSELLAIKEALILYSTHLELSGRTEGLAIFSDSRATLE
ncbi:uncharacterized protein TNCV_3573941 [Trichonephila clavipes]|nr:uncharacterized protein TNCV_3573941 [Trichonephila clavipes]